MPARSGSVHGSDHDYDITAHSLYVTLTFEFSEALRTLHTLALTFFFLGGERSFAVRTGSPVVESTIDAAESLFSTPESSLLDAVAAVDGAGSAPEVPESVTDVAETVALDGHGDEEPVK